MNLAFHVLLFSSLIPGLQQVKDIDFEIVVARPAFPMERGPKLCFDEAHYNFHTSTGRYAPFVSMMRADGYRVDVVEAMSDELLADCDVLVIVNALSEDNADRARGFPHESAFAQEEVTLLYDWVNEGGALFLVADHPPFSPAVSGLTSVFGATPIPATGVAVPGETDVFRLSDGTLRSHAIVTGRIPSEAVSSVATFSGSAFHVSEAFVPLLVYGPDAYGITFLRANDLDVPREELPRYRLAGLAHVAVRAAGLGRIALLGEASMCTAQTNAYGPFGMNHPDAGDNQLFCLNVVRWLAGALDD